MDTLNEITRLFEYVRRQGTPVFDVSDLVITEIRMRESVPLAPLSVFTGMSAVAACIVLFYAVSTWLSMTGYVAYFVNPVPLDLLQ